MWSITKKRQSKPKKKAAPTRKLSKSRGAKRTKAESVNKRKRLFVKTAGALGIGALAASLIPKRAEAYVFGSTPASNVVGIKDSNDVRIDPALESGGNLEVIAGAVTANKMAVANTNLDRMQFTAGTDLLKVSTTLDGSTVVGINNAAGTRVSPATEATVAALASDESVLLLRRIARHMESLAVVDSAQRQRVTIDSGTLPAVTTVTTVTTITNAVPVGNVATLGSVDPRYLYIDTARTAYANGIRANL